MTARTVTTREFVCDNCGDGEIFDHDADAGRAGWALVTVNGKEFALCPQHYQQLKDLLHVNSFGPPLGSVKTRDAGALAPDLFAPQLPPRINYPPTNQER